MWTGEAISFSSVNIAPATRGLKRRRVAPALIRVHNSSVNSVFERADPLFEGVRPDYRSYAEAAGGARLGEKANEGAE
jgi:hypothetical protein